MLDGLFRRRQPLAPLVGLGLGLLGAAGVPGGAGLRGLRPVLLASCCGTARDARRLLRVGASPVPIVGGDLTFSSTARSRPSSSRMRSRGTFQQHPQRSWIDRSAALALSRPAAGSIRSASASSFSFFAALASNSASRSEKVLFRREKKASCAARKRCPELVLDLPRRAADGLPLGHQPAVGGRRVVPVGGVAERQRLGADDERLLRRPRSRALPVQVGEVRAAAAGEGVAGFREPLQRSSSVFRSMPRICATRRRWPWSRSRPAPWVDSAASGSPPGQRLLAHDGG